MIIDISSFLMQMNFAFLQELSTISLLFFKRKGSANDILNKCDKAYFSSEINETIASKKLHLL